LLVNVQGPGVALQAELLGFEEAAPRRHRLRLRLDLGAVVVVVEVRQALVVALPVPLPERLKPRVVLPVEPPPGHLARLQFVGAGPLAGPRVQVALLLRRQPQAGLLAELLPPPGGLPPGVGRPRPALADLRRRAAGELVAREVARQQPALVILE